MTYQNFKKAIHKKLSKDPSGLTWRELKVALQLPYDRPCPEWVKMLENEIGLDRSAKKGNALIWRINDV